MPKNPTLIPIIQVHVHMFGPQSSVQFRGPIMHFPPQQKIEFDGHILYRGISSSFQLSINSSISKIRFLL